MALEIYKSVMMMPPSSPMPSYIFRVNFRYTKGDGTKNELGFELNNENDRSMYAIKCDLPTFETHIKTLKYFGSQKTYPVIRTHSGDTSLEFYIHSDPHENNFTVYNFFKKYQQNKEKYYHKEFIDIFDEIEIEVWDRTDNLVYDYILNNCIVTKVSQGTLSYESDDVMKFQMDVHYDDWSVVEYDIDENEKKGNGTR